MKPDRSWYLTWLLWRGRLRLVTAVGGLFVLFAGIMLILGAEETEANRPETAVLLAQRVIQTEDQGNKWLWVVEIDGKRVASVKAHAAITFEPEKVVCIKRRKGKLTGIERSRILHEGACPLSE